MKKNYFIFSLLFIYSWIACVPTLAAEQNQQYTILTDTINKSERDDRQYQVIKLDNDMKVLLISDKKAVKSLASLALPVGSLHDPKSQQGLAHYTEHMVLMGSKKYPQPASFSRYLSQHSGHHNASTAAYRTAFYFEVENEAFAQALDQLADAIAEPLLNAKYANKERNAVDSELTMARSSDGFRIGQVDSETINQAHPSAMFSGGNLETLSDKEDSILQTELETFYHRYYSANIMVGVIYSDKSLTQLAELAVSAFGQIENKNVVVEPITQVALTPDTLGKWIYMEPAQPKKVLYLQFPIENNVLQFTDKSDEYLSYMISNRSENALFDLLQNKGLIESVSASPDPIRYGNSGIFGIYVTLTDQGLIEKESVIQYIFNYLQLIKEFGVNETYYNELNKVLALEFKYPDITRNMSYVEWLSDQMLFYPTEHILEADYVATHFNEKAIMDRLALLTPDNARIWVIAPNQKTDKEAYFVNAPYRVENITQSQHDELMSKIVEGGMLLLPSFNPYMPSEFSTNKILSQSNKTNLFNPKGNHFHFASEYFSDEPKAAIALSLRNNSVLNSAKNQVMFYLTDYLANRELAQLRYQASVAGINVSTQIDSGLMIQATGFNQYITNIVEDVVSTYGVFHIDEANLALAKSWYLEKLDSADHAKSYQLAMQPVNALSTIPYFERDEKRAVVSTISVSDLEEYREDLIYNAVPYMLSIGNLSYSESYYIYKDIKDKLDYQVKYQPDRELKIDQQTNALITQNAMSTDNALFMGFVPTSSDKITDRVTSYLLYKIISPWFYDQLRSNEQLGYAVFSLPVYIGESAGIGFLIQSNQYNPAYLNERYQAFYPIVLDKLKELEEAEFEQYKQSIIDELLMPPQTLDEEFSDYLGDFRRSQFNFDSKQKKIARIKTLTKDELISFYQKSVMEQKGLVFGSQVLGNQQDKTIEKVSGLTPYHGASELQKQLLTD